MKILFRFSFILFLILANHCVYSQTHNDSLYLNAATQDAGVFSGSTGTNYGTSTTAIIASTGLTHYRFFSYFNIGSLNIPSNAIISSATLSFTPVSPGEGTVNSTDFILQTVTASWAESTITYANQPATTTTRQVTTSSLVNGKRTFNVVNLVQNIVNNTTTNYGWRIHRNPENTASSQSTYATAENSGGGSQPILRITWYVPRTITAASITHCKNLTDTTGSISPTLANGSSSPTYSWTNSAGTVVGTSATLTNRGYGWYGLKVTGSLGDLFYMSFIIGANCNTATITYDPGPNFIDDSKITSQNTTTNYGTGVDFIAQKISPSGTWYTEKSLLKFKLWVDTNLTVSQADLVFTGKAHIYSPNSNASYLNKITQSWAESSVTWATAPTTSTSIQASIPATTSATQPRTVDIISFVNDWKNNNITNYGMMMELQSASNVAAAMSFHSSDAVSSSNYPKVNFQFFVNGALAGTVTPGSSSICSGSTTTLTLTGYSTGATFQWQSRTVSGSFSNISGATSSSYTTLSSTLVDTYYRCVVSVYSCSAVNSNEQLITIKPVPTVSVNNATICTVADVTLTATPSIGGGTYLWSNSATTSSIVVAPSTTTTYTVVYTLNGCASPQGSGRVDVCSSSFQFTDSTEVGQISVSINEAPSKVGPYHYQVSQFPNPSMSTVYHLLKDSIYGGTLDSASFFLGSTTEPNFTFYDLKLGRHYVSVFDSRGVRIFDREISVYPSFTLSNTTSMTLSGNTVSSTGTNASTIVDLYLSEGMNGEMGYIIADKTKTQFMGFVNANVTTPGTIASYKYGFSVKSNALYLIENGVEGGTSYTINNGSEVRLRQTNNLMEYYADGVVIKTSTLADTFCYKNGATAAASGVQIKFLPSALTKKKFFIKVKNLHFYDCGSQSGGFNFTTYPNIGISNVQFTWKVYKDGTLVGSSGTTPVSGPIMTFDPSTFGPGVYRIRTITNYSGADHVSLAYVYLGVEADWTDQINYNNVAPNDYSVERTISTPNTYSYARAENLLVSTQTGWIQFNPILTTSGTGSLSRNVLRLSTLNPTSTTPIATEIASLKFYRLNGINYLRWTGPTQDYTILPSNSLVRLKINSSDIGIYVNNVLMNSFQRPANTILVRAHSYKATEGFDNVITSFDCDPKQPLSTLDHSELKRQLDGGFTLAVEGKVKFTFDEEYAIESGKKLQLKIYDEQHELMVESDMDGTITPASEIVAQDYGFDDNRYTLDMSSITGISENTFYILEVETSTHEKRYLKILYKY